MAFKNKIAKSKQAKTPIVENLESRTLLSVSQLVADPAIVAIPDASSNSFTGYTPAQIQNAYGFNSVALSNGTSGTGAGQIIAIVDAYGDPNISADLAAFDAHFGLAAASLSVVNQNGGAALPSANAGWSLETSLDVEWAHAVAPGAAILLVEANSANLNDLLTATNYARGAKGVSVVSMSWGSSEFFNESSYDGLFTTTPGHKGVTFVAASGDSGSWNGPEWPASSANVLSVGGTTLNVTDASGNYGGEIGWSGSTGGISQFENEPAYQKIAQLTGGKTSPDVSYNADPSTGFSVFDSVTYQGNSGWWDVGGTSAGAPQWAALIAIADQGRALQGMGTLDSFTQTLPTLFSLYNANQYFQAFHDETSGASSFFYSAGPGYDAVTGLGSPRASTVINDLISFAPAGSASASPAAAQAKIPTAKSATSTEAHPPAPVAAVAVVQAPQSSQPISVTLQPKIVTVDSQSPMETNIGLSSLAATKITLHTVSAGQFETIQLTQASGWHNPFSQFSTSQIISGIDQEIATTANLFNAGRAMSSAAGASSDIVENLAVADASALARVAGTLAARLYEEGTMIWKDTGALLVVGVIALAHLNRPRRHPSKKVKKEKYLCIGEQRAIG